jgi:amino acid permease
MSSDNDILAISSAGEASNKSASRSASLLLFAIENRTAHLVLQARRETAIYQTAATPPSAQPEAGPLAGRDPMLEALSQGRELTVQPTIQDLERYASHWASLVPEDAALRAAVTFQIGEKYLFTFHSVPSLRQALGLDTPPVQQAYQAVYSQPLATIYAPTISWLDHLRWQWARLNKRLENLPPFWTAFLLTLPGAPGLLALPIAFAGIGPLAGIALLIGFGLINILTVAALAESVARSGTTRFGLGFLGQLVDEYLGSAGSLLLTVVLAANNFLVLIIFYLGVAGTLASSTHWPSELWIIALFGVCLYFLSRRSLNSTVSSALLIVLINLLAILIIPLLVLPHFQSANFFSLGSGGSTFDPAVLGLVIGVMLSTYFSHFLVASYGPVVLRRDVSGRSWIAGSVASSFAFMLIALLWMVAVNGAIPNSVLAGQVGTVLEPLADQVGSGVQLLGALLVILSLGLASIQVSLGLYYIVAERLPVPRAPSTPLNVRLRFLFTIAPVIAAFLLAEWLALTGMGSFAGLLGTMSALLLPLLGGIFPVLLLAATRRKGDFVPGGVSRLLGHPLMLSAIFLFYWATILLHGLVIWQDPFLRLLALSTGLLVLGVTIIMLRRGALDPRMVIELRQDRRLGMQDEFNVTANGRPLSVNVRLEYPDGEQRSTAFSGRVPGFATLRAASFELPPGRIRHLTVWAHQMTPDSKSLGLPMLLQVSRENAENSVETLRAAPLSQGLAVVPLSGEACSVRLSFP